MRHAGHVLLACAALAACGAERPEVGRLSEVELAADSAQVAALTDPAEMRAGGGLFSRLFGRGGPEEDTAAAAEPAAEQAPPPETRTAALAPDPEPGGGGGFLGRLFGGGGASRAAPGDGPDRRDVAFGTVLPYGELARVCDYPSGALGREVARHPERGRGYRIHDSDPGNTAPHTFYVTGFADGCARQFTAALAVFGSPEMHEQLRYGLPAQVQPYSTTDEAYETLKSRICRVRRNSPCGARIDRLERTTVFVSVYERFGDNARWKNILLHDGAVLALDMKSR
ncbi:MAG: hypothetical protein ACLFQL_13235 [Paracoccaceae bacterium]